jgi:hypothetical protein
LAFIALDSIGEAPGRTRAYQTLANLDHRMSDLEAALTNVRLASKVSHGA